MKKTKTILSLLIYLGLSATAQAANPIVLGLNYPRTGNYKDEGADQLRGATLAIEEINRKGGVMDRPLKLSTYNTASRPEKGVRNVETLAKEGAAMIFGGASSAVAIAAGKKARELGLLYFGTLTYSNDTTGKDGHRYMFRESNNAWMSAQVLGHYLTQHHPDQPYFYVTADYTWGHSTESSLRQVTGTTDTGRHPSARVPFPDARKADYRSALEQAAASKAEVLVLALFGNDLVRAMPIVHQLGLHKRMQLVVPNLTQNMVNRAGPTLMQDVLGTEPWTWRIPDQENNARGQAFVKAYRDKFALYPSSSAASAYSIVYQWADAVRRTRSLDSETLIKALENHRYSLLKDQQIWRGFDHQNIQTVYALRVRKNSQQSLEDQYARDFFEIVAQLSGEQSAQTRKEWEAERRTADQPLQLQ